ncbi:MAG: hypothetical protein QM656_07190 [Paracoccaceae bacterium]
MRRAAVLALALTAAPALAEQVMPEGVEVPFTEETLPPGYPPKLGDVTATLDGKPAAWETYDFSIGAFDASAWIDSYDGFRLKIIGYTPGNPDAEADHLVIEARFDGKPRAGDTGRPVLVEIYDKGLTGRRASSEGKPATLTVDRIKTGFNSSGYGSFTGSFRATLCPKGGKTGPCREIAGRFDTGMQYEYPAP